MDIINAREKFSSLSITQICDAVANNNIRIITNAIYPFVSKPKMLGRALTVMAEGDLLPVIKSLELATSHDAILIDSGGSSYALAGEIFATEAKRKQIAGIVVDGFCRDADSIAKIGLPFYARGIYPMAGSKSKLGKINVPIQCGGVAVFPGDIVLGDENGIVILNEQELLKTLSAAEEINQKEERALKRINTGTSILDIFNFSEHYQNIAAEKESHLKWQE